MLYSEVSVVPGWGWVWFGRAGPQALEKEESEVKEVGGVHEGEAYFLTYWRAWDLSEEAIRAGTDLIWLLQKDFCCRRERMGGGQEVGSPVRNRSII